MCGPLPVPILVLADLRFHLDPAAGQTAHASLIPMSNNIQKEGVFITHITEEAPIANALKTFLLEVLGNDLKVFVSSDSLLSKLAFNRGAVGRGGRLSL